MNKNPNNRGRSRQRGPAGKRNFNHHQNHSFSSNGPNGRERGTAYQLMEKYLEQARDAASQGDRILAENCLQHADHYHRIILASGAANPNNPNNRFQQRHGDLPDFALPGSPQPVFDVSEDGEGGGGETEEELDIADVGFLQQRPQQQQRPRNNGPQFGNGEGQRQERRDNGHAAEASEGQTEGEPDQREARGGRYGDRGGNGRQFNGERGPRRGPRRERPQPENQEQQEADEPSLGF